MPLQYVIDAYNIINHSAFHPIRKKIRDHRKALLEFLKHRNSFRKSKSIITVVFDGYPDVSAEKPDDPRIDAVFSREETADAVIKRLVETSKNPRNISVVSDDREVQFFVKSSGAQVIGVEEFINPQPKKPQGKKDDLIKAELNYSQISMINRELKELWLKD